VSLCVFIPSSLLGNSFPKSPEGKVLHFFIEKHSGYIQQLIRAFPKLCSYAISSIAISPIAFGGVISSFLDPTI
jgi:hypothetical protein